MRVTEVAVGLVSVPLRHPFVTALRTVTHVTDAVVRLRSDDGLVGFGEAPPTPQITGETLASLRGAWEFLQPRVVGAEFDDPTALLDDIDAALVHNSSAKAALDMALHDLWGRSLRTPCWQAWGGTNPRLETDLTISIGTPAEMAANAAEAVERGFGILKVKVGTGDDVARLAAVRAAVGPDIVLRVDANQGWTAEEAITLIRAIEDAGLAPELVEQPVPGGDVAGLARVTAAVETPILADEAVFSAADAQRLIDLHAADMLNIKLMKAGGLLGGWRIARLAEQAEITCMVGSMLETKLAVNAAAQLAAAAPAVTLCDLDGPQLCAADPILGGAVFDGPHVLLPDAPGLGIDDIEGVEWEVLS